MATADYLDSKGSGQNFLNDTTFSASYKELAEKWSALPMYKDDGVVQQLATAIEQTSVTLVISGTGSGKTVIVPKVAARVMSNIDLAKKIAVTNPKSSTTLANAEYAANCMDVSIGEEVGYHFRGSSKKSKRTKLLYLTDGMLLAQARGDPMLSEYSCVIIDEAHERPPPVDFLLQASIDILRKRPLFRLVVMSATIDADLFAKYFTDRGITVCTIIAKGQQSHAVEHVYESGATKRKYLGPGMRHLNKIVADDDGGPGGDILWFVPTSSDAVQGCTQFPATCDSPSCAGVMCTELFSKASADMKASSLAAAPDPYLRKVIFATNVAESSFTFPGLGYVIDSGLELSSKWDAAERCQVITKRYTSQAQMTQREGRVGRQGPGKVYHLYSESLRKRQPVYPDPHIVEIDLTQEVLAMFGHGDMASVVLSCKQLLTPPTVDQISSALAMMHFYKMIVVTDKSGLTQHYNAVPWASFTSLDDINVNVGRLTPFGILVYAAVTGARLSPWTALLYVIGAINGTGDAAFALASILEDVSADPSAMYPLVGDLTRSLDQELIVKNTDGKNSDHGTLLRIFAAAKDPLTDSNAFNNKTGMSFAFWSKMVARVHEGRASSTKRLIDSKLPDVSSDESVTTWSNAFSALNLEEDGYPAEDTDILKIVMLSRLYHFVKIDKNKFHLPFSRERDLKFQSLGQSRTPNFTSGVAEFFVHVKQDGTFAYINTHFGVKTTVI